MAHGALLCAPKDKAPRETANAVAQVEYLAYLVEGMRVREVRESHLLHLQALAVEGIYPCGGHYRDAKFGIEICDSAHTPPTASLVPALVNEMLDWCNDSKRDALERAAFALWRFNWIHPFAGGNGRTARALSYLIVCIDSGKMLPGPRTVPGLIAENRTGDIDALQAVDAAVREASAAQGGGVTTLPADDSFIQPMALYLGQLLLQQLKSAEG